MLKFIFAKYRYFIGRFVVVLSLAWSLSIQISPVRFIDVINRCFLSLFVCLSLLRLPSAVAWSSVMWSDATHACNKAE